MTHYFKEVSVLAMIDQLVKGIIGALNRTLFRRDDRAAHSGGWRGSPRWSRKIVDFSLTYVDEAIIGYTFRTKK